jgi:hypothetical protein
MSMKKCEDERIYHRNGVLLKNPSRRIEAGSVVDRLNEDLVQDDDVPRVLSTGGLLFQPEYENSVIEDDGRVRNSFRRQKTMIEGAVPHLDRMRRARV